MHNDVRLTDGFLLLRPPCREDAPALAAAVRESLAELEPWMDWASASYDEAAAARWLEVVGMAWEHGSAFHFAVTDARSGEYIGGCGIDGVDEKQRSCNLSYWVRTRRTKQGFAVRAAKLVAVYAFEQIGLQRAEIVMASGNSASLRVAQKTGAHYEGALPNGLVVHSEVHDALIYALTPTDFDPHNSNP